VHSKREIIVWYAIREVSSKILCPIETICYNTLPEDSAWLSSGGKNLTYARLIVNPTAGAGRTAKKMALY